MTRTGTVVIGAGQAGLAMSRCLAARGVDHVVLERGRIGERWQSERWDTLKLLTPNWMTRLPGWSYAGPDPDGYMNAAAVASFLRAYAYVSDAPVRCDTAVERVSRGASGYSVATTRGTFKAASVVIATGHCDVPAVPAFGADLPARIVQVVPSDYRRPDDLPPGGVLVVGASATGLQLADEIHRSGRPVTLAVGHHTRLPRTWRGLDIMAWLDRIGALDERWTDVADLDAARRQPSLQLVGRADRTSLDLGTLAAAGVRLVGRATGAENGKVHLAGDLARRVARAEDRMHRLLARIDAHIEATGTPAGPAEPIAPVVLDCPATSVDLAAEGISAVVWATGFTRDYSWLDVPVLDAAGEIRHDGGVTPSPGLYVLGLRFLRRRKSSFIDGAGADAAELSAHLTRHLRAPAWLAA